MTNFDKVIENLNTNSLAHLLSLTNACPYYDKPCKECQFNINGLTACGFPNSRNKILKWLESEAD